MPRILRNAPALPRARASVGPREKAPSKLSNHDLMDERAKLALKLRDVRTPEREARLAALDAEIARRGGYERLRAGLDD